MWENALSIISLGIALSHWDISLPVGRLNFLWGHKTPRLSIALSAMNLDANSNYINKIKHFIINKYAMGAPIIIAAATDPIAAYNGVKLAGGLDFTDV